MKNYWIISNKISNFLQKKKLLNLKNKHKRNHRFSASKLSTKFQSKMLIICTATLETFLGSLIRRMSSLLSFEAYNSLPLQTHTSIIPISLEISWCLNPALFKKRNWCQMKVNLLRWFTMINLLTGKLKILFRFTPQRSITINPPTQTLHVSSIKKELCREDTLRRIFGDCGNVEKVKILHQSSEKNMALIKFSSMEDSFYAISELHNKTLMGRKMQISFTKSRLWKIRCSYKWISNSNKSDDDLSSSDI